MERRKMISLAVGGIGLLPLVLVGLPSLGYFFSSGKKRVEQSSWRDLGKLDDFPVGEMRQLAVTLTEDDWSNSINQRSIYVWRQMNDEFVVFSRSCTDLGCPVVWDPGSQWFFCPCHGGIFSKDGEPKAGPPNKPLYRYVNRIQGGILQIDAYSVPPMI